MSNKRIHHPLLGDVDVHDGPSVLDEHPVDTPAEVETAPTPVVAAEPVEYVISAPDPIPEAPSIRRLARRIVVAGLRALAKRIDEG